MKKYFIVIVFLLIGSFYFLTKEHVQYVPECKIQELSDLTLKEREYLNNFFHSTMTITGFGYVLLGDKPMSFSTVNKNNPILPTDGFDYMAPWNILNGYRKREGWAVWKKYAHRFELKGFTLKDFPPDEMGFEEVCFINHKNFIQCVKDNYADFEAVLGESIPPEEILQRYINDNDFHLKVRSHDGLFGTLLGFGRNNAWEFMRRGGIDREEEWCGFPSFWCNALSFVYIPMFVALKGTEETKQLYKKYSYQRMVIRKTFWDKDFITPTIQMITGAITTPRV